MVSHAVLAVAVVVVWNVGVILGYWLGTRSADSLLTWLKEQVLAYQERWHQVEEELARERRARQGKGDE
jgi:hypothetical protein